MLLYVIGGVAFLARAEDFFVRDPFDSNLPYKFRLNDLGTALFCTVN